MIATRESWTVLPLPEYRAALGFAETYTSADFERLKCGLIPEEMEDKWFIFYEDPWLYFHRSWTGAGIYGVEFHASHQGASVAASWVSRDATQYGETSTDHDRDLLKFLIDALLLGKHGHHPDEGR